jgi:hypothetical protein
MGKGIISCKKSLISMNMNVKWRYETRWFYEGFYYSAVYKSEKFFDNYKGIIGSRFLINLRITVKYGK